VARNGEFHTFCNTDGFPLFRELPGRFFVFHGTTRTVCPSPRSSTALCFLAMLAHPKAPRGTAAPLRVRFCRSFARAGHRPVGHPSFDVRRKGNFMTPMEDTKLAIAGRHRNLSIRREKTMITLPPHNLLAQLSSPPHFEPQRRVSTHVLVAGRPVDSNDCPSPVAGPVFGV